MIIVNAKLLFESGLGGELSEGAKAMVQRFNHRIDAEKRVVRAGMTTQEAVRSWGEPTAVNRSVVAGHSHEQWVYRYSPGHAQYLYFQDGVMTGAN